jgi:hypothetical protein
MIGTASDEIAQKHSGREHGFPYLVDGKEFISESPKITGLEIMERAGIPPAVGLIEIGPDGVQRPVPTDEIVDLNQPHRFRRPPRFKRG